MADAIRGHSVQRALTASSARAQIKDPALAELVRQEQDLSKQVNAQLGTLNNVLALPSGQRDENGVKALNACRSSNLRSERDKLRADIAKRFPSYANLIDPKPPSRRRDQGDRSSPTRRCCRSISAATTSFVWAVPKDGQGRLRHHPGELGRYRHQDPHAAQGAGAGCSD